MDINLDDASCSVNGAFDTRDVDTVQEAGCERQDELGSFEYGVHALWLGLDKPLHDLGALERTLQLHSAASPPRLFYACSTFSVFALSP